MEEVDELRLRVTNFDQKKEAYEKKRFQLERELGLSELKTIVLKERLEDLAEEFKEEEQKHKQMIKTVKTALKPANPNGTTEDTSQDTQAESPNQKEKPKKQGRKRRNSGDSDGQPPKKGFYVIPGSKELKKRLVQEFDDDPRRVLLSDTAIVRALDTNSYGTETADWCRLMGATGLGRDLCTQIVKRNVGQIVDRTRKVLSRVFRKNR